MLIVYRNIATGSTWFAAGCKKDRWTSVDVDYQGKFFFATVWPLLAFTTIFLGPLISFCLVWLLELLK